MDNWTYQLHWFPCRLRKWHWLECQHNSRNKSLVRLHNLLENRFRHRTVLHIFLWSLKILLRFDRLPHDRIERQEDTRSSTSSWSCLEEQRLGYNKCPRDPVVGFGSQRSLYVCRGSTTVAKDRDVESIFQRTWRKNKKGATGKDYQNKSRCKSRSRTYKSNIEVWFPLLVSWSS